MDQTYTNTNKLLCKWGTHPEYTEIRHSMLDACGVVGALFARYEASLAPAGRGNLLAGCMD